MTSPHPGRAMGGVVLAGGAGRRFGRPKADLRLGDASLVERAVTLLAAHCGDVVVASRAGVPLPALDVRVVHDDGERSAIGGLRSGLEALDTDSVLVLACDLLVVPAVIERLQAAPGEAAVAVDDHGVQPLCARYPRSDALAACRRLMDEGDLRVRRLADLLAATPVAAQPGEIRNMNTWPDAFAAALDVPPLSDDAVERILLLTREVAHGTERMNGPLASFLVGFAAGRGDGDVDATLDEALVAARALLPPGSPAL